jgi:hypothetical protein
VRKEVKKMKRKIVLGTLLTLTLALITVLAAVTPSLAVPNPNKSLVTNYFRGGSVILQLPPAPNATPPASPGTPTHPIDLMFAAFDFDRKSTYGANDALYVFAWVPLANTYVPVAVITDSSNPASLEFNRMLYNNTPIWSNSSIWWASPNFENVISVGDKDLEVWTDKTSTQSSNGRWVFDEYGRYVWDDGGGILAVNLTTPVTIRLPFNLFPAPISLSKWGNLTFVLPAMTLTFHEIGDGYPVEETNKGLITSPFGAAAPYSGYTVKLYAMRIPSWVEVSIPAWLGSVVPEVTGHMGEHGSYTYTPPA